MNKIILVFIVLIQLLLVAGCSRDRTYNPYHPASPFSTSYPCKMTVSIIAEGKPITITRTVRIHEYLAGGVGDTEEVQTQGVVWVQHRLSSGANIYLRVPHKKRPLKYGNPLEIWELGDVYYVKDPKKEDIIEEYAQYYHPDRFAKDANIVRSSCVAKYEPIKGHISSYDTNDFYLNSGGLRDYNSQGYYYYERFNIPFHSANYRVSLVTEIDPSHHAGLANFLSTVKKQTIFTREQLWEGAQDSFSIKSWDRTGDVWHMTPLVLEGADFSMQTNKAGILIYTKDNFITPSIDESVYFVDDKEVGGWLANKTITIFGKTYPAMQLFEDVYLFNPETGKLYDFHFRVDRIDIVDTPPQN